MSKYKILCTFFFYSGLFLYPLISNANTELSDPTRPADFIKSDIEPVFIEEYETNEKISWTLSAIKISDKDKSAIVNGKLVRVGDEVDSGIIDEINPLSVVVNYEDQKLIVRLFNNIAQKEYKTSK